MKGLGRSKVRNTDLARRLQVQLMEEVETRKRSLKEGVNQRKEDAKNVQEYLQRLKGKLALKENWQI